MSTAPLPPGGKAVAYYRVSTDKQGVSGLGLEAQKAAVTAYALANGFAIAAEFTEVETGTGKRKRVEIYKALDECKRLKATLIIAKLDRLARNVHFISGLQDAGVSFVAVDNPHVNKMMVQLLAAFAEEEARMISSRTKAALAARKARGLPLGCPANLRRDAQVKAAAANKDNARHAYGKIADYITMLHEKFNGPAAIARKLNEQGHRTRTGAKFAPNTVKRIIARQVP